MDAKLLSLGVFGLLLLTVAVAPAQPVTSSAPALQAREAMITSGVATPLDLETNYTTPVTWLNHIDQFPAWRTVPRGFQMFNGVPLDVEGLICLWGEGNTTKLHIVFPEERKGIAVNRAFESLYIYHCSFFTSSNGVPVYSVVYRYEDGTSATNTIHYGEDIVDWVVKDRSHPPTPTAARSSVAWTGGAFPQKDRTDTVLFTLTALTNPQPALTVQTIDLYSSKSRTAPCIMGMTIGKSGLVKRE